MKSGFNQTMRLRRHSEAVFGIVAATLCLIVGAGCTPSARQDVGAAGADLDRAADKSVAAAGQAVDRANRKVAADARVADKQIGSGVDAAVQGTEKVAARADEALHRAGADVSAGAQVASITPRVKMAILRDESVKIKDLNVDTHVDKKIVVVNGIVSDAASHKNAIADANSAVVKDAPGYSLVDHIQSAGAQGR